MSTVAREHWKSKLGFMWSAIGSAIGLGSIWRFPYIVGENGGAAFVLLFCVFLIFLSLPVLMSELLVGRKAQLNPEGAFYKLGKSSFFSGCGKMTVITGFLVSAFYSVIVGWTMGYLLEAIMGNLTHFSHIEQSALFFASHIGSASWVLGAHLGFMVLSIAVLYVGVQKGIERWNKVLIPLLFFILLLLIIYASTLSGFSRGIEFLFSPDFGSITPSVVLMALGQAFFGLSIGQGTMVTYGSYLKQKENIPSTAMPIAIAVILVSLLAGMAIFPIVFTVGAEPSSGMNLMFETLPMVFSRITGGYILAITFFLLLFLAGLTSQISAMEPFISYLMDKRSWSRNKAVLICGFGVFLLGIPCALSFGVMKKMTFYGWNFFDCVSNLSVNLLIPLGALSVLILIGWRWKTTNALANLRVGTKGLLLPTGILSKYLSFSIKYLCPIIILYILFYTFITSL